MKRFFCTTCKRVKRVQKYPSIITDSTAFSVTDRVGTCDWHVTGVINGRPVKTRTNETSRNESSRNETKTIARKGKK